MLRCYPLVQTKFQRDRGVFTFMFARKLAAVAAFALSLTLTTTPAEARFWQCAPYARLISGVNIFGNAHTWWTQAVGKYTRGAMPKVGAVMSFASTARMRLGHVAMVSKVVNAREVLLTHANWSRRGQVETNVRAVDVSDAGDWSRVKVWFSGIGGLGTSSYPVNGFIYGKGGAGSDAPADAAPLAKVVMASVSPVAMGADSRAAKAAKSFDLGL
jgi:surface antigen